MTQEINTDTDKITEQMMRKIVGQMRRPNEPALRVCSRCKLALPIENFYLVKRLNRKGGYYLNRASRCKDCENKRNREGYRQRAAEEMEKKLKHQQEIEAQPAATDRTCRDNCEFYPCFTGIDTMSSNLALTCLRFKRREL